MAPETPRGVSSRLLTMKFMQRAVASANSSPDVDSNSAKKRKLGHSPAAGRIDMNIDEAAIKAALDDQETKRQVALDKHVGGDTHWVLDSPFRKAASSSKPSLNVVYVGYGDIDSSNESGDNEEAPSRGRTSIGKSKASKKQDVTKNEDEDSDDSDSENSDAPTPGRKRKPSSDSPHSQAGRSRSRSRSQSRQSMETAKAKEFRDKRKKKEVKLSKLSSVSSGGGISSGGGNQFSPASSKAMTCYKCHQAGHKAVDCSKAGGFRGRSNQ